MRAAGRTLTVDELLDEVGPIRAADLPVTIVDHRGHTLAVTAAELTAAGLVLTTSGLHPIPAPKTGTWSERVQAGIGPEAA